jgi:hypothetical protein
MGIIKTFEQKLIEKTKNDEPNIGKEDLLEFVMMAIRQKEALTDMQIEERELYVRELVSNHF